MMTRKFVIKIFFISFLSIFVIGVSFSAGKKETTEAEDVQNEFKESKFLQLDNLDLPKELQRIEDQIKQNAIDVIISSKTHTPVYAQKRVAGYTDSYKNFHGLDIQIVPIPNEQDFYSLTFFYYNWTNRKFDKRLRKRISKYNVLNELRFGLYELLLGKKFVDDHKDEIEKQNYDRILAVRETEESQERIERKKKKLEKKKKEEEEEKLLKKVEDKKKNKLLRGDKYKKNEIVASEKNNSESTKSVVIPTKDVEEISEDKGIEEEIFKEKNKTIAKVSHKKTMPAIDKNEETSAEEIVPTTPEILNPDVTESIPTISSLYVFGNFFDETVTVDGILHTLTHLQYLGFGARYIHEQETAMPRGMRFSIKTGLPIKKDNFAFPIYRSFETEIYKRKIFNNFQLLTGIDYSPIYFVNLPNAGEGLQVFENDIFWLKGGIGFNQEFFGKVLDLRMLFFKSLSGGNSQKKSITGTSLAYSAYYQHTKKHGVEIAYQKTYMAGDLQVESKSLYFSYIYKFEN